MFGITTAERCSCGLAIDRRQAQAFNEEAFRYLLGIHRKRAERTNRPFLLVLVELHGDAGAGKRIQPAIVPRLFAGLCRTFRETDLIGWYRERQTAGVILVERGEDAQRDIAALVTARVSSVLAHDLGTVAAGRLDVRVCRIQPTIS
jgi:hypothetical protein